MMFLSIGTKLIVLVLGVSLVSIAITTGLAFNSADSIIKTNVEEELRKESQARGKAITDIIQNRVDALTSLASSDVIHNILLKLPPGIDDITFNRILEEDRQTISSRITNFQQQEFDASLRDLKIINNRGKLVYSLTEATDFKPKHQLSDSEVSFVQGEQNERLLRFSVPITSNGGKAVGAIIAITDSSSLDSILLNRFGLEESGEVYLVNKDRMRISESPFTEDAKFNQIVDTLPVERCFNEGQNVNGVVYPNYIDTDIFGVSYCQDSMDFVLLTEVNESAILEPIYALQQTIIITGTSLMVIATIATYVLSKRISRPILKLRDTANSIANGNFDARTEVQTNDEIGQLASSFDSMTKTIKETLSAIARRNDIIKRQEDILQQFSQKKQEACVCLVDIVGSLKITENLSEEQKKRYYEIFTDTVLEKIRSHKGTPVKFINDAVLFYFPVSEFDDAFTTSIDCCLEITSLENKLNEMVSKENLPGIGYRISMTTGQIDIVSGQSSIEDIFGEPASLAFKINQYALPNTLVVEQSTYEKIKEKKYKFTKLDKSLVKELEYDIYIVSQK